MLIITQEDVPALNTLLLEEELSQRGVTCNIKARQGPDWLYAEIDCTEEDEPVVIDVLRNHDPTQKSQREIEEEKVAERQVSADEDAAAIPGWASWTEDQAVGWIEANVTDLASAKTALVAMARMVIALRNKQWPHLEGG